MASSSPRMTNQVSRQVTVAAQSNGGESPDAWIGGVVSGVFGGVNSQYQVYLDTQDYVSASSTIDSPIEVGDLVFVTRTGGGATIVGLQ